MLNRLKKNIYLEKMFYVNFTRVRKILINSIIKILFKIYKKKKKVLYLKFCI